MPSKAYKRRAIVIGTGVAGLASAIRLAIKGYDVAAYEANSYPGGKLTEIYLDGYRFDAGPSLFTLPSLVDELFLLAGENPREHFHYTRLPVVTQYFYPDGLRLTAHADPTTFAEEIARKTQEPAEKVLAHLNAAKLKYETTERFFLQQSLHKLQTYLKPAALKALLRLPALQTHRTMHSANAARFTDPRIVQLFDRYATYNGSDPYQAPATLNLIPHLEFNVGAFFPEGGMQAITQALFSLAERLKVKFYFNSKVNRILHYGSEVKGVQVNDTTEQADVVFCNMDMHPAYTQLLPDIQHPKRLMNQPRSSSALIFYWGIKQQFPQLDLHNIFFSNDYRREFRSLFKQQQLEDDATIYLNISSKYAPRDAPAGCENWFVMLNAPHLTANQNWEATIDAARKDIQRRLSDYLQADIAQLTACEAILTPALIQSRTSSYLGALYGTSSNRRLAAFLRHPNFSNRIRNLYFCGGSVHPGGGIPLCLLSAKIATELTPEP